MQVSGRGTYTQPQATPTPCPCHPYDPARSGVIPCPPFGHAHTATPSATPLHLHTAIGPPATPSDNRAPPTRSRLLICICMTALHAMHSRAHPGHALHLHGTAHSLSEVTPTQSSPAPNISPTPREQIPTPGTSSYGGFQGCLLGSGLSRRLLVLVGSVGAGTPPALQPAAAPVSPCVGLDLPRAQDPLPPGWDPATPHSRAPAGRTQPPVPVVVVGGQRVGDAGARHQEQGAQEVPGTAGCQEEEHGPQGQPALVQQLGTRVESGTETG